MALETKVILRSALFNVSIAKNHKQAIRAIRNMCDAEDIAVVNESVAEYLEDGKKDNEGIEDDT